MQERIKRILQNELPQLGTLDREELVGVLSGRQGACSPVEFANFLVESGFSVHSLMSALLKCENAALQSLVEPGRHPSNDELARLSHLVDGFSAFKLAVVKAAVRDEADDVGKRLDRKVLAQFQSMWEREGQVQLYNYFCEMPVSGSAKLISMNEDFLQLEPNREIERVFTVADNTHEAFTMLPEGDYMMRLGVTEYRDGVLNMAVRAIDKTTRERRSHVRICPDEQVMVKLSRFGQMVEAYMADLSISGIGLEMRGGVDLQPGEMDGCLCELDGNKIYLESLVCWVEQHDSGLRAGLKFASPGAFSAQIHHYLMGQQHKLIGRLRTLGAPPWMRRKT